MSSAVLIAPHIPFLTPGIPERETSRFFERLETHDGWEKANWVDRQDHYDDFVEFFFNLCVPEAHSTKQLEDLVGGVSRPSPRFYAETSSLAIAAAVRDALGSVVDYAPVDSGGAQRAAQLIAEVF